MDARHTAGLNNAPPCSWSQSPPSELTGAPLEALSANAGFVSFGNSGKSTYLLFTSIEIFSVPPDHYDFLADCSDFPTSCGGQKTGQNCLGSINISCIC